VERKGTPLLGKIGCHSDFRKSKQEILATKFYHGVVLLVTYVGD
jgi:hypothetical protein